MKDKGIEMAREFACAIKVELKLEQSSGQNLGQNVFDLSSVL